MFKQWGRVDSIGLLYITDFATPVSQNGTSYFGVFLKKGSIRLNSAVAYYGRCWIPSCFPLIRKHKKNSKP
jgi:hypothetical protein